MKGVEAKYSISENVTVTTQTQIIDGEYLDTTVKLDGAFVIAGRDRDNFRRDLAQVIDRYRI